MEFKHYSVLRDETIENLNIRPDGIYVDGTLGGAGHSYEIAKRLSDKGRLIGIDQDADAIKAAGERLAEFGDRVTIVRSNYSDMKNVLHSLGIEKVDGIMLDLGVSSFQLDTPKRGFTYRSEDAPLDMRMDDRNVLTARDIVNTYSENDLYRIIRDYGEDKFAKNIAKHIAAARQRLYKANNASLNSYNANLFIDHGNWLQNYRLEKARYDRALNDYNYSKQATELYKTSGLEALEGDNGIYSSNAFNSFVRELENDTNVTGILDSEGKISPELVKTWIENNPDDERVKRL